MEYQIIDDFLDQEFFNKIKNNLINKDFPWMYRSSCSYEGGKDGICFTHCFYNNNESKSSFNKELAPLYKKLKARSLKQSRANLILKDPEHPQGDFHCDYDFKENLFTAILHVTNNNGYTLLGRHSQKKVKCKENTMIIFPVDYLHASGRQTDDSQRIVLNINYYV